MMGNQRQALKSNIERELVSRVETAKDILQNLAENLESCKESSTNAKQGISQNVEALTNALIQRRNELTKEVDNLYGVQIKSLEEAMKTTYITMGRLQNMLTNIDSFDQSQLFQLQIPNITMPNEFSEPTHATLDLNADQLIEEIKEYGNVSTEDGFQCCLIERMETSFPNPPAVEETVPETKTRQVVPKISAVCESCPWSTWGIEKWLSGNSRQNSLSPSKEKFVTFPSQCSAEPADIEDFLLTDSGGIFEEIRSESSIMCVDKNTKSNETPVSDISEWLKPRLSGTTTTPSCFKYNAAILSSDLSCFLSGKRKCSGRSLDFPCLQMTAEAWVHSKKSKPTSALSASSDTGAEPKLIPSCYTLPNPFWLNKYQQQHKL